MCVSQLKSKQPGEVESDHQKGVSWTNSRGGKLPHELLRSVSQHLFANQTTLAQSPQEALYLGYLLLEP